MSTTYFMRAYKTTPTIGYVHWSVIGAPDITGVSSGYNPLDLSNIIISSVSIAGTGSSFQSSIDYSIDGYLSLISSLPSIFDAPIYFPTAATISSVDLIRRAAGTSGSTMVDILVDGVSIFSTDGYKPQISFAAGDNAINSTTTFISPLVSAGKRIEAELEVIEGGNPSDIRVTIRFA